jgi:hypothetical protein
MGFFLCSIFDRTAQNCAMALLHYCHWWTLGVRGRVRQLGGRCCMFAPRLVSSAQPVAAGMLGSLVKG